MAHPISQADPSSSNSLTDRRHNALLGTWIGDALAMPAHWYYNRGSLNEDYGRLADFVAPKSPHPDSILWRSKWEAPRPELDILGDQRPFWGLQGVHYHQNLRAGENTLTVKLAALAWQILQETGEYDADDYLRRYIDYLTPPQTHRDTYLEECHRGFFTNLGRSLAPQKCGVPEKHIGGLVMMLPVALFFAEDPDKARAAAIEHLSLTHSGEAMRSAGEAILSLLLPTLHGKPLAETVREEHARQRNPHFGFPLTKWLDRDDEDVIGKHLSTGCYIDQAVPAVIYLALKYAEHAEEGLIANTNLGGDNVHRGGVLGALLGAGLANEAWPTRWTNALLAPPSPMRG